MTLLHHIPNHATWFLKTISSHKYEERRIEVLLALGPSALGLIWASRVDMTCDMKNAI